MGKIFLCEYTAMLKIRIEKALAKYHFNQIEQLSERTINLKHLDILFRNADMLILDYDNTPNSNELLSGIRTNLSTKNLPVLVMTHATKKTIINNIYEIGATEIITKPFTDFTLIEKVFRIKKKPDIDTILEKNEDIIDHVQQDTLPSWNSDFMIGVEVIDNEHKNIMEQFGILYNVMREGKGQTYYKELITFLGEYANTHFRHEEAFQKEIGYPKHEEQLISHENFRKHIHKIIEASSDGNVSNLDLVRINIFLKEWLIHHILIDDKQIGVFIKEQQKKKIF